MSRWIIFILLYLSIYGSAHLYLLIKARRAFYLEGVQYVLLWAVLTFLLLAPINARLLQGQGQWLPAVALTWIGYTWMGFVFIFVCQALIVDGYHLMVSAAQQILGTDWTVMMLSKRQSINLLTFTTCIIMIYGAFEAHHISTEKVTIRSSKIPPATGRIRIVQVSDLHISSLYFPARLTPVITAIRKAKPDILVSTGDLVDGRALASHKLTGALQSLSAPLGKFAVTGNHEFYTGIADATAFTQEAGFTLLRNRSVPVDKGVVVITGVDDPAANQPDSATQESDLLKRVPRGAFSLLLKHRPIIDRNNLDAIDLQLSGHTHKGQIFPFDLLVRLSYPLRYGLQQIAPDRHMYVSRGAGTWGPPIRVLAKPEITIIDLMPTAVSKATRKAGG